MKVISETKIVLGAKCRTDHGKFEIGVSIRVNVEG